LYRLYEIERRLREAEVKAKVKAAVIGVGGAGCSIVSRLKRVVTGETTLIAVDTDAVSLRRANADEKLLIGEDVLGGRGTAGSLEIGVKAMEDKVEDVARAVAGKELVIVTGGLGGGTGSGGIPVIGKRLKEGKRVTIAVVNIPFSSEGDLRRRNAKESLKEVMAVYDAIFVNFNDKLLTVHPGLSLINAFRHMDKRLEEIIWFILTLQEARPLPGLIHVDFNVFKKIAKNAGLCTFGRGKAPNIGDAFFEALRNKDLYCKHDITGCKGVIIEVIGPENSISPVDATRVPEYLSRNFNISDVYWGVKPEWVTGVLEVCLLAAGVKSQEVESFIG